MPNLKQNRLFRNIGYAGNLLGEPIALGDICFKDEGVIRKLGNVSEFIPDVSLSLNPPLSKVQLKFDAESKVETTVGANVEHQLAKGEVELKFKTADSAFVCLKSVEISSLNFGLIQDQLWALWKKKRWNQEPFKHILVTNIVAAQSGVVIFSGEKNNRVVLSARSEAPALNSVAAVGSGKVEIIINSKQTQEVISETPIQPLFGCMRFNVLGKFDVVK